ncbi:LysR substrate-binding domain-containing protein [Paracoccus sp. S1E-3]|uniref:LysR substrate-binding domain-containing protein n=1 Tax=Paracoccus sp. S1E-3 TaxID=2756130 RepID=UPI0015EF9A0F|nr:LysR substrate-binding domain-containing protein [Paracoccus sp. S1E-3]MBA4491806.1 LysR family transcriptional regulator [Paracoccus sp. S1E-3]
MEINWIEDFMVLAVTRNFSRAAETRNVSQPAFSRRIRNLEYWVGAPLLDRSVFPIALTPAGEAFRKRAEDVLRSLQYAREEARGMVARPDEVISFAALHTLGINFFPRWLAGIEAALGKQKTRVVPDNLSGCVEALISGSCDAMLCYSHPGVQMSLDSASFPSVELAQDRIVPVSAPDAQGRPRHDLGGSGPVPYLCYSPESFLGRLVQPLVEAHGLNQRLIFHYENSMAEALKPAALAGAGVAWLPELAIRDELAQGTLLPVGPPEFGLQVAVRLYRMRTPASAEMDRLWAHAAAAAAGG